MVGKLAIPEILRFEINQIFGAARCLKMCIGEFRQNQTRREMRERPTSAGGHGTEQA
ncbi:hypothetical protein thalar_02288 [Litoreibacter arenae DSM 19593]|uniref:Uncharacterized protein n=1 Tax=Litoreibacter arenae DSM 19593 TaxID=1123360 RepID=S9QIQ6_9RHOB|nr:hypothetical protein thalar_02288 [Litoreibacter arenae DSM 19593]